MQTPKSRTISVEVPQRTSLPSSKTARKLRTQGQDLDSVSSPNRESRTPKDRSPKVVGRRSPRSPAVEQKRPGRLSDLENQLGQLQEEVKKAKGELSSSELLKQKSEQEADEAKKQLAVVSEKLEESEMHLLELSSSEDRDRAWQSELDAARKQHELDSAALISAMDEIQKLKIQLDSCRHAESTHAETQSLREGFTETLILVEQLRMQLNIYEESEACMLNIAKKTDNNLWSAVEDSQRKYQEECIESALRVTSANEMVAITKSESIRRETEWSAKLNDVKAVADELKEKLMNKEVELMKSESMLADLRASLLNKETENDTLKIGIMKKETESSKVKSEVLALVEASRTAEKEALMKLARVVEELNAAQTAKSETEAELSRLKVQSDQWRKAAEAAAAMFTTGNNGKYVERTGSLDYHTIRGKLRSPLSEDMDGDDSSKKKNGNMLKKIGSLLKRGQK